MLETLCLFRDGSIDDLRSQECDKIRWYERSTADVFPIRIGNDIAIGRLKVVDQLV
jgi:hypothetical protein